MKFDIDNPREKDLTMFQRLQLQINGDVAVGKHTRPGWSGDLTFYAFRCREHGLVCDYLHGHWETLSCPKCVDEKIKAYELEK